MFSKFSSCQHSFPSSDWTYEYQIVNLNENEHSKVETSCSVSSEANPPWTILFLTFFEKSWNEDVIWLKLYTVKKNPSKCTNFLTTISSIHILHWKKTTKIAQGRENYDWIKRDGVQRTPASTGKGKRTLQTDQSHRAKTFGAQHQPRRHAHLQQYTL